MHLGHQSRSWEEWSEENWPVKEMMQSTLCASVRLVNELLKAYIGGIPGEPTCRKELGSCLRNKVWTG